ncbi:MAG: hypothetical protein GTO40_09185 [Deltaproteobacteria bacterium]|nr:hypothetical protein [Deltaproteobacteria bacterium]
MNVIRKTFTVSFLTVSLVLLAHTVQAQREVDVKVGDPSPSVAGHSHDHNITVRSVTRGKSEYTLRGKSQDRHKVNLTRSQKSDLRDGTTVIIRSTEDAAGGDQPAHSHQVTITLKGEEAESSGW